MKSKTQGHALGVMWSYINDGQCLENAHDSMVDAKAGCSKYDLLGRTLLLTSQ